MYAKSNFGKQMHFSTRRVYKGRYNGYKPRLSFTTKTRRNELNFTITRTLNVDSDKQVQPSKLRYTNHNPIPMKEMESYKRTIYYEKPNTTNKQEIR